MEIEQSESINEKSDDEVVKENEERKKKRNREYQRAFRQRKKNLEQKESKEIKEARKRKRHRENQRAYYQRKKGLKKNVEELFQKKLDDLQMQNMDANKLKYVDALINEVKKRPVIWDKKNYQYDRRKGMAQEWQSIATKFKKKPEEVKKKWRGLRDTFHLEERKLKLPTTDDEQKPLISYYHGQWAHFEKLDFLFGTRGNAEDLKISHHMTSSPKQIEENKSETCTEDVKIECDLFEHTDDFATYYTETSDTTLALKNENDSDIKNAEVSPEDKDKLFPETTLTRQNSPKTGPDQNINDNYEADVNDKSDENDKNDHIGKQPVLTIEPLRILKIEPLQEPLAVEPMKIYSDTDEDVLFVRSLVPYFRRLNPIRKLIVKNEMQNLVIKEMLCYHCRSFGPQPNCRCNLN